MARAAGGKLSLTVAEALPKDVGRGIARMDPDVMVRLKVGAGDIVELGPQRKTGLRAMPTYPEQRGQGAIQIDAQRRRCLDICPGANINLRHFALVWARACHESKSMAGVWGCWPVNAQVYRA